MAVSPDGGLVVVAQAFPEGFCCGAATLLGLTPALVPSWGAAAFSGNVVPFLGAAADWSAAYLLAPPDATGMVTIQAVAPPLVPPPPPPEASPPCSWPARQQGPWLPPPCSAAGALSGV
jgi:hypothetical protein